MVVVSDRSKMRSAVCKAITNPRKGHWMTIFSWLFGWLEQRQRVDSECCVGLWADPPLLSQTVPKSALPQWTGISILLAGGRLSTWGQWPCSPDQGRGEPSKRTGAPRLSTTCSLLCRDSKGGHVPPTALPKQVPSHPNSDALVNTVTNNVYRPPTDFGRGRGRRPVLRREL